MDIKLFVNITSRAWAIPILSCMHEGVAGRQAKLLAATGANRTSFAQSMEHLIDIGLIERNPGYGHPLRPEFRLTSQGVKAAAIASGILGLTSAEDQDLLRRSWTLPILTVVQNPTSFNEIKRVLNPITDRALSQALKSMEERNWLSRHVDQESRPPRSIYLAINLGQAVGRITAQQITIF